LRIVPSTGYAWRRRKRHLNDQDDFAAYHGSVSNIYKYYVAYKLALAQKEAKQQAEGLPPK